MTSAAIRQKFITFFEHHGHKHLPSSSLVPEGDISVLFTTAGMQQFKPYYGAPENAITDFGTKNIVTIQKCVRTGDIDEVGDATHLSFFEMLGNFSFGGYGKKDAISYAHKFITEILNLEISYVTVLGNVVPFADDQESIDVWKSLGIPDEKIVKQGMKDVFWGPTGDSGPCGPTTEIYCKNGNGEDVEIWNIVFNQYFCKGSRESLDKGAAILSDLPVLGIDTGMGFERLLAAVQEKKNVYETDLFESVINSIKYQPGLKNYSERSARVIADHARSAMFLISDGVIPSKNDRGYVLRRLIRRAVMQAYNLGISLGDHFISNTVLYFVDIYKDVYPKLEVATISKVIIEEESKFATTVAQGLKEFEKGTDPFILFTTYGFPIELTEELAQEKGVKIDQEDFNKKMAEHQKLSQTASAGMFKGGLASHNERTTKLHTAHHLLLAALQQLFGKQVKQRGSNITDERLRIDFSFDRKLTAEEIAELERIVNEKIGENLCVIRREMLKAEAEATGAEMEFGAKYPDTVSVYFIESETAAAFSKEFCGGPHSERTGTLGRFKILKEEAVAQGVRRIKATLE